MTRRFPVPLTLLLVALLATPLLAQSDEDKTTSPMAKIASFKDAIDPATGRLRELTPAETRELRASLEKFLKAPQAEAAKVSTTSDGLTVLEMEQALPNMAVARLTEQGEVEVACVDTVEAAVSFMTRRDEPVPTGVEKPAAPSRVQSGGEVKQ